MCCIREPGKRFGKLGNWKLEVGNMRFTKEERVGDW